jgi:hypothetical protein
MAAAASLQAKRGNRRQFNRSRAEFQGRRMCEQGQARARAPGGAKSPYLWRHLHHQPSRRLVGHPMPRSHAAPKQPATCHQGPDGRLQAPQRWRICGLSGHACRPTCLLHVAPGPSVRRLLTPNCIPRWAGAATARIPAAQAPKPLPPLAAAQLSLRLVSQMAAGRVQAENQ